MRSILALSMTLPLLLPAQPSVDLSETVAAYAEAHMGTKVGRGECWDLAQAALNTAGARWDGRYVFGDLVKVDAAQRGDIVQFDGVLVEHRTETSMARETLGPHTAIVLDVFAPGRFLLAHQNFGPKGRKVSRYELVMADVKRGTITFFRPVL
jgi:hypothetical protein